MGRGRQPHRKKCQRAQAITRALLLPLTRDALPRLRSPRPSQIPKHLGSFGNLFRIRFPSPALISIPVTPSLPLPLGLGDSACVTRRSSVIIITWAADSEDTGTHDAGLRFLDIAQKRVYIIAFSYLFISSLSLWTRILL